MTTCTNRYLEIEELMKKIRRNNIRDFYIRRKTDPQGYFSSETFDISFNYNYLKEILPILESSKNNFISNFKEKDKEKLRPIEYYGDYGKLLSEVGQIQSHEAFHFYQSLTIPLFVHFSKVSREHAWLKYYFLYKSIPLNYKYVLGDEIINKNLIKFINEPAESIDYLHSTLSEKNSTSELIFSDKDGISIFEILEGSAISFQLITNRDINFTIFKDLEENKTYSNAFNKFITYSGIKLNSNNMTESRIIFLLVSYYTLLSKEKNSKKIIDIFIKISSKSKKYLALTQNKKIEKSKKNKYPKFKYRDKLIWFDDSNLEKSVEHIYKKGDEYLDLYILICDIVDCILDDINLEDENFLGSVFIFDKKMKKIKSFLKERFLNLDSLYFIPYIICDYGESIIFSTYFKEIHDLEFEFSENKIVTVEVDSYLHKTISQIENIISNEEKSYCCEKHGMQRSKKIIKCQEEFSFANRVKLSFNNRFGLENFINEY